MADDDKGTTGTPIDAPAEVLGDGADAVTDAVAPDVTPADVPAGPASGRTLEDIATILDDMPSRIADAVRDVVTPVVDTASAVTPDVVETPVTDAADAVSGATGVTPDETPAGTPWIYANPFKRGS